MPPQPPSITDAFATLGLDRQPWLEAVALKNRFLTLSADAHPDRFHQLPEPEREAASQRFASLNAAYNCLRDTKARLQHLLHLERGAKPREVQAFPDALMDLFGEVSKLGRQVDGFLEQKERAVSPLLKVAMAERSMEWTDKLEALLAVLQARQAAMEGELKEMNGAWEAAPPIGAPERLQSLPLLRLEELYRDASYLARWTGQLRERLVQLGL